MSAPHLPPYPLSRQRSPSSLFSPRGLLQQARMLRGAPLQRWPTLQLLLSFRHPASQPASHPHTHHHHHLLRCCHRRGQRWNLRCCRERERAPCWLAGSQPASLGLPSPAPGRDRMSSGLSSASTPTVPTPASSLCHSQVCWRIFPQARDTPGSLQLKMA